MCVFNHSSASIARESARTVKSRISTGFPGLQASSFSDHVTRAASHVGQRRILLGRIRMRSRVKQQKYCPRVLFVCHKPSRKQINFSKTVENRDQSFSILSVAVISPVGETHCRIIIIRGV